MRGRRVDSQFAFRGPHSAAGNDTLDIRTPRAYLLAQANRLRAPRIAGHGPEREAPAASPRPRSRLTLAPPGPTYTLDRTALLATVLRAAPCPLGQGARRTGPKPWSAQRAGAGHGGQAASRGALSALVQATGAGALRGPAQAGSEAARARAGGPLAGPQLAWAGPRSAASATGRAPQRRPRCQQRRLSRRSPTRYARAASSGMSRSLAGQGSYRGSFFAASWRSPAVSSVMVSA